MKMITAPAKNSPYLNKDKRKKKAQKAKAHKAITCLEKENQETLKCGFCAGCVCHTTQNSQMTVNQKSDRDMEMEIIAELQRAIQNSELHNTRMVTLEREIRKVRIKGGEIATMSTINGRWIIPIPMVK